MTVNQLCEKSGFEAVVLADGEREVCGCYIGDLLSLVMGRAKADDAWITIMSNVNIVAVAALADVSCIILSEGVVLDSDIIETAKQKEINILYSAKPSYETAVIVSELI